MEGPQNETDEQAEISAQNLDTKRASIVLEIFAISSLGRSRLYNPALNCHAEVIFALMVFRCFQMINLY